MKVHVDADARAIGTGDAVSWTSWGRGTPTPTVRALKISLPRMRLIGRWAGAAATASDVRPSQPTGTSSFNLLMRFGKHEVYPATAEISSMTSAASRAAGRRATSARRREPDRYEPMNIKWFSVRLSSASRVRSDVCPLGDLDASMLLDGEGRRRTGAERAQPVVPVRDMTIWWKLRTSKSFSTPRRT